MALRAANARSRAVVGFSPRSANRIISKKRILMNQRLDRFFSERR